MSVHYKPNPGPQPRNEGPVPSTHFLQDHLRLRAAFAVDEFQTNSHSDTFSAQRGDLLIHVSHEPGFCLEFDVRQGSAYDYASAWWECDDDGKLVVWDQSEWGWNEKEDLRPHWKVLYPALYLLNADPDCVFKADLTPLDFWSSLESEHERVEEWHRYQERLKTLIERYAGQYSSPLT